MLPFLVIKLEWLTETRFVPQDDFGICLSFPSVGSHKHKVLEVGLLKGHNHLNELPISLLVELDWKDQVCPSLPELLAQQTLPKHAPQNLVGMGESQGLYDCFS